MTHEKIGICGLGRMGSAIAQRLIAQGQQIAVWNRNSEKARPLVELGALALGSPAEAARACDIVITMLFDGEAVRQVYEGPDGLLSAGQKGRLFIDMSTIGPRTAISIGERVEASGSQFVECPVGGTVGPAREGKLLGLAGGSAEAFARARPILELLCRRIEHAGPVGAGSKLKLAVNLPLLVYWQALNEALGLVTDIALSPDELIDLMADTSGAPNAVKMRVAELAKLLSGRGEPTITFDASGAAKDLREMVTLARELDVPVPVTEAASAAFDKAIGGPLAGRDTMAMIELNWTAARGGKRK